MGTQRRAPRAAVCADVYTRCVNTQTTVAEVVRRGFPWCTDYTNQLAELFRSYVAHKRGHGLVDFDDLMTRLRRYGEEEKLATERWSETCRMRSLLVAPCPGPEQ